MAFVELRKASMKEASVEPDVLQKRLDREVKARQQAEKLLEERSLELYSMNLVLQQAADRLTLRNAQLDKILEKIWTGVLLLDEEHKVVRSNAYADRAFNYDVETITGMDISALAACSGSQFDKLLSLGLDVEEAHSEIEMLGYRSDGARFPMKLTLTEASIQDKKHYIWIFRDLTKEKAALEKRERLEEELRRALRLESLGTLASGLAHEINTPVQYVSDNLHFLSEAFSDLLTAYECVINKNMTASEGIESIGALDCEGKVDLDFLKSEIPNAVSQALEGADRVTEIIKSVRNFSHPGAKEKSAFNINEALHNTATISRNQWKYIADIKFELETDLPEVECIPGEINQVLLNLVVNAAHAIEDKGAGMGTISMKTRSVLDYVEIRIKDTGSGISDKNKDRIFDPFFTTKGVGKGTGQGLSLAHNIIVSGHGGKILFETQQGEGTTFIVLLPISAATNSEPAASEECA